MWMESPYSPDDQLYDQKEKTSKMAQLSTIQALCCFIFGLRWLKKVIYVVLGVNEKGYRKILDFFVGGQNSVKPLQKRCQEVL